MTAKFVVRLLDDADTLLAWAEVYATARPQDRGGSCPFWPDGPTKFVVGQDGLASKITVHWCDLDVARFQKIMNGPVTVIQGQVFDFAWLEPVWLVGGMRNVALPPVTVGVSQTVKIPVGTLIGRTT